MKSLKNSLQIYQKLLQETEMQVAYRELIKFILKIQLNFKAKHPEYEVSKGLYQGYNDIQDILSDIN